MIKNLPVNAGDLGLIPGSERSPGEGNGKPLQDSYLENPMDRGACGDGGGVQSMGQRNLVGYSPWDHKESDMTKRTHFS